MQSNVFYSLPGSAPVYNIYYGNAPPGAFPHPPPYPQQAPPQPDQQPQPGASPPPHQAQGPGGYNMAPQHAGPMTYHQQPGQGPQQAAAFFYHPQQQPGVVYPVPLVIPRQQAMRPGYIEVLSSSSSSSSSESDDKSKDEPLSEDLADDGVAKVSHNEDVELGDLYEDDCRSMEEDDAEDDMSEEAPHTQTVRVSSREEEQRTAPSPPPEEGEMSASSQDNVVGAGETFNGLQSLSDQPARAPVVEGHACDHIPGVEDRPENYLPPLITPLPWLPTRGVQVAIRRQEAVQVQDQANVPPLSPKRGTLPARPVCVLSECDDVVFDETGLCDYHQGKEASREDSDDESSGGRGRKRVRVPLKENTIRQVIFVNDPGEASSPKRRRVDPDEEEWLPSSSASVYSKSSSLEQSE